MNNVEFIGRYELTTGTDILLPKSRIISIALL